MSIKKACTIMLLLVTAVSLAFTGGKQEEAKEEAPVEINMILHEGEEEWPPVLKKNFEAENPGIVLNFTVIPEDMYTTKIDTMIAAGSPPELGYIWYKKWMKAGHVVPLNDYFKEWGVNLEDLNAACMNELSYEGKYYAVGTYSGAVILWYDKDMFDAAGIPYLSTTEPLSVDEYAELANKLKVPSEDYTKAVYGGAVSQPFWYMDHYNYFSKDGRTVDRYANDEATIHAFDVLANMTKTGAALPSISDGSMAEESDLFIGGRLAMIIADNFTVLEMAETAGLNYGVAPVPAETSGEEVWASSWTDAFGAFKISPNVDAALKFLEFVAKEGSRLQMETTGALPLNLKIAEDANWAGASAGREEMLDVLRHSRPTLFTPGFWDVTIPLEDAYNNIVDGIQTAEEALNEAVPRMQDLLDQAWETWEALD